MLLPPLVARAWVATVGIATSRTAYDLHWLLPSPPQDQLVAAGERERELQRKLVAAELKLEDLTDRHNIAGTMDNESYIKKLIEQRDTANAALQVSILVRAAQVDLVRH